MYIPRVYKGLTSDCVLTMEFMSGHPVADADELQRHGIEPQAVARLVAQARPRAWQ